MNDSQKLAVGRDFGFGNVLWRFAVVLILVFATYNPTRACYINWLRSSWGDDLAPGHFVVGVALLIGWTILIVATQRSLGILGLVLAAALIGGIVWWLSFNGWLAVHSVSALTWIVLVCLSVLLTVGLSWSHIWRRLTGQYEVDDNDT